MRYIPFTIAAVALAMGAACSSDERETSFVSEAHAAASKVNDYGWRPSGGYVPAAEDTATEYY